MDKIKLLQIRFDTILNFNEVPYFRGAVIGTNENMNILFHGHESPEKLRYSYPLIQYKLLNKKAAIICIDDGTLVIDEFLNSTGFIFQIGNKNIEMKIEDVQAKLALIQTWDDLFSYNIHRWLALNSENYTKYKEFDSIVEKYSLLENILTANILSLAKGIGIHFEHQVICKITNINHSFVTNYKGVKMIAFNVEFKSNVSLPSHIGLGKGVSIGYGVVSKFDTNNKLHNDGEN